jgi:hypothetical protein
VDPKNVKAKLIEVLIAVQTLSGETCPTIDGGMRPVEALPKFTSKIWPVAAGMLGLALGKPIPCETNIFVDEQTKVPLTIDQTIALVIDLVKENEEVPA